MTGPVFSTSHRGYRRGWQTTLIRSAHAAFGALGRPFVHPEPTNSRWTCRSPPIPLTEPQISLFSLPPPLPPLRTFPLLLRGIEDVMEIKNFKRYNLKKKNFSLLPGGAKKGGTGRPGRGRDLK